MPSTKTEVFLDSVCAQITWKYPCCSIRAELSAHIEDHITFLMEHCGMSFAQAETEALRCMGDPAAIGKALNRIHRRWILYLLWGTAAIFWISISSILLWLFWTFLHA